MVKDHYVLSLKYSQLRIEFPKNPEGMEHILFDIHGNLVEINSIHGNYSLKKEHVTQISNDIPKKKLDELIQLSYRTASKFAKEPEFEEAIKVINDVGYEGYKKREDLEGWNKFIPPFGKGSLILYNEVMTGCPRSKDPCIFCNIYAKEEFSIVPFDKFSKREKELAEYAPIAIDKLRKGESRRLSGGDELWNALNELAVSFMHRAPQFFWGNGNIFALKPKELLKRFEEHNKYFRFKAEALDVRQGSICAFGHSKYILNHADYLKDYHALGLREVWVGVESGHEESLKIINKGATVEDHIKAGNALEKADISCNATVIYSAIDAKLQDAHIEKTIELASKMKPSCIYFSDLIVHEGTKLDKLVKEKKITLLEKKDPIDNSGHGSIGGVITWHYDIAV